MTDNELELYFRNMNELFRTKGWLSLLEEMRLNIPLINSVEKTKDEADLNFRKGQLNIIGTLLNLEETTRIGQEASQETPEDDYVHV
jgi:hypothetical protein